jgi:hypothetical protein
VGLAQKTIQGPPNPQFGLGGSFASWHSPWAFSYNPMLYANVPSNVEHNHQIGGSRAALGAVQDHHAPALAHPSFSEQLGGASTGGTQDTQNRMPGGNSGFEF